MLRRTCRQDEGWASDAVERILEAADPGDILQRSGLAHTAIQRWCERSYRSLGHDYLLRMLCFKEEPVLEALSGVFLHKNAWQPDLPTWELMDSLTEHPEMLQEGHAELLAEILAGLAVRQAARVARLTQVLIRRRGERRRYGQHHCEFRKRDRDGTSTRSSLPTACSSLARPVVCGPDG